MNKREKNLTEIVFILDRSGSMSGLEGDTVGGYNAFIEKQKREEGDAKLTTVLFDDKYEVLHDRVDIRKLSPISEREYYVRGTTALIDAIGRSITKMLMDIKMSQEDEKPNKVIFVITTDGYENASCEYSIEEVRNLIENQKKEGWEFIFLGANIDAVKTAGDYGISSDRAANFNNDAKGVSLNYQTVSEAVADFRKGKIGDKWKTDIDNDYKKRGRNIKEKN